jgi:hypothetical protein
VPVGAAVGLAISVAAVRPWRWHSVVPFLAGTAELEEHLDSSGWPPPFLGEYELSHDTSSARVVSTEATPLDGLSMDEILSFRSERVARHAKLHLFPPAYEPLNGHARRIFASITPGAGWLGPTPYYIANPYALIVLTCAGHVTPLSLACPEVRIRYKNRRITETHVGPGVRCFLEWVHDPSYAEHPGTVRVQMVNAYDAGFRYAHVDREGSANIAPSADPANITQGVYSQPSVFHVGRYGVNNISPLDRRGWVRLRQADAFTRLLVKLWRNRPRSPHSEADLLYEIVIDPQEQGGHGAPDEAVR